MMCHSHEQWYLPYRKHSSWLKIDGNFRSKLRLKGKVPSNTIEELMQKIFFENYID